MKASLALLLPALLLPAASLPAQLAPSAFVETTTLTFGWGFTQTYVSNASTNGPALPGEAVINPEDLPEGFDEYTDTLTARPYTASDAAATPTPGSNKQIINLLLQRMVREGKVSKEALGYRWQLIAVRELPRTVKELATNPYYVMLSSQPSNVSVASVIEAPAYTTEPVDDDPFPRYFSVDTGIRITLGQFSGNYTEASYDDVNQRFRRASGSVSTAFTIDFGALFYEDPRYALEKPENTPKFNYHLKGNYWEAYASGLINYTIRSSTSGSSFIASKATATGTGWWRHTRWETAYKDDNPVRVSDPDKSYRYSGTAPLRVTMSTIQYQKRSLFPILSAPSAPFSIFPDEVSDTEVQLAWFDGSAYETGFELERRVGVDGAWTPIATLPANTESYTDTTVTADTTYYYRVRAVNAYGKSAYATTFLAVVTPPAP